VSKRFQTTRWSVVLQARGDDGAASHEALEELCRAYWFPVYGFVRGQGCAEEDAKDVTQSFFSTLLDKGFLDDLTPERGRFRSFLLVSVRNFLFNERDRERALKRGGGVKSVPLDVQEAERRMASERAELSPENSFELRWALTVVRRSMRRLEVEFANADQQERFQLLQGFLVGDAPTLPYGVIAARLDVPDNTVKSMVRRLRQRFGALLRAEVAQTMDQSEDVDSELRHLLQILESR